MKQPKQFLNLPKKEKRKLYPDSATANSIWNRFRIRNKIKREMCVNCHKDLGIAHHPDYSRPLEIVWLCRKCHTKAHMGLLDVSRCKKFIPKKDNRILSEEKYLARVYSWKWTDSII